MKRNNSTDFSKKTRQSYVAILLIIYKTYTIIVKQAWPFIIYFLLGGGDKKNNFLIGLSSIAVIGMVWSIVKFFRYYFYIAEDGLIIEQGVFKKAKTNVPFDRIQTINFEQNILHRIFNVVKLKVDTAGSSGNELEFDAIDHNSADLLRNILLSKKTNQENTSIGKTSTDLAYSTIMKLDVSGLIKAGMVENHLRSSGIIVAGIFWIWQSARDLGVSESVEGSVNRLQYGMNMALILIVLFIVFSFVISMVRMVVKNYNLCFLRSDKGFKIIAGLFTQRDTSALDHKIQMISWSDNPLKKLLGIKDLRLRQASSKSLSYKKMMKVPGCKMSHILQVTNSLYGQNALDQMVYTKVHSAYFYRAAMYLILVYVGLMILGYWSHSVVFMMIISIITFYLLLTRFLSMRKKNLGLNHEMLILNGGTYGDKTNVLPIYKIQSVSASTSPYQRRKGLASLQFHTASGRVGIPFIDNEIAIMIKDFLVYKIETDTRKWM